MLPSVHSCKWLMAFACRNILSCRCVSEETLFSLDLVKKWTDNFIFLCCFGGKKKRDLQDWEPRGPVLLFHFSSCIAIREVFFFVRNFIQLMSHESFLLSIGWSVGFFIAFLEKTCVFFCCRNKYKRSCHCFYSSNIFLFFIL